MDIVKQVKQKDEKPFIEVFPGPVLWISELAKRYNTDVNGALNRHWLETRWNGSKRVDIHQTMRSDQDRVFRYRGTGHYAAAVDVFEWNPGVLFICMSREVAELEEPEVRLDKLQFSYDEKRSFWFSRGTDVTKSYLELCVDREQALFDSGYGEIARGDP